PRQRAITHLTIREGHLLGRKDVTIPISEVAQLEDGVVYLKLSKEQVEQLPETAVDAGGGNK
ncbi:MAG TPA: hypothetical protein VNL35_03685, partial [Chloroflexota bacterium]|nr:hypothetical protein [Chloroflexota bacterium]